MSNWIQRYERRRDESIERELNRSLQKDLDLLDETFDIKKRKKLIENIIEIYDGLRIDASDYDEHDYMRKKTELAQIRYQLMKQNHMENIESKSWNEYREEEQKKDLEEGDSER